VRSRENVIGTGQLLRRSVAPAGAPGGDRIGPGRDQVELAVAQQRDARRRRQPLLGERAGEQDALVRIRAVQFAAVYGGERCAEPEVLQNLQRVDARFGRTDEQRQPAGERVEQLAHAGIDDVLEQPGVRVADAKEPDDLVGLRRIGETRAHRDVQRRSDQRAELRVGRHVEAEFLEREPQRPRETFERIAECAVQVEEQRVHCSPGYHAR
jgi:hypothetical protein